MHCCLHDECFPFSFYSYCFLLLAVMSFEFDFTLEYEHFYYFHHFCDHRERGRDGQHCVLNAVETIGANENLCYLR
jgi:hypothetical protein